MTAGILDPSPAMTGAELTSTEEALAARIDGQGRDAHSVAQVATVLGAAFLLYRAYMKRRLYEEMRDKDPSNLAIVASAIYQGFVPRWVQMLAPALVSAYVHGMREAGNGSIPDEYMLDIAMGYAENLGEHINQVSMESLMQGYQAQLNRRVVARRATENVIGAFGVPLRTMNALVTVWTGEQKKVLSRTKPTTPYDAKAAALIEKAVRTRGKAIGETEAWTAKSQAKQLVWMWGVQHGTIPDTATRVWRTAHDERVCPACGPMDKTEVPVGKPFTTDAGEFWSPPLHPNCRCDIDLAINILDEFRPIREEELVDKALGDDPYDRDRRGRFAHREARVADAPKVKLTPVNLPGIEIPDEPIEADKLSLGGKLSFGQKLTPLSLSDKISFGEQDDQLQLTEQKLTRQKQRRLRLSQFKLPTPEQVRLSLGKEKGDPPKGYHTLPTPLWGFVGTKEETEGQVMMDVDEDAPFFEPDDIEEELANYWNDELQLEWDTHYSGDMDDTAYKIMIGNKTYVIDTDTYVDVLQWVIDGKPKDQRLQVELEELASTAEDDTPVGDPDRKAWVQYAHLVDHLGFDGLVAWRTPTLMLSMYGTEETGMSMQDKRALQNPGRWAITEALPDSVWGKGFEKPVKIVYAEPPEAQYRYGNPGYTS